MITISHLRVILLFLLVGLAGCSSTNTPQYNLQLTKTTQTKIGEPSQLVKRHLELVAAGKTVDADKMFSEKSVLNEQSQLKEYNEETETAASLSWSKLLRERNVEFERIIDEKNNGKKSTVVVSVKAQEVKELLLKYNLVEEEGNWFISSINFKDSSEP